MKTRLPDARISIRISFRARQYSFISANRNTTEVTAGHRCKVENYLDAVMRRQTIPKWILLSRSEARIFFNNAALRTINTNNMVCIVWYTHFWRQTKKKWKEKSFCAFRNIIKYTCNIVCYRVNICDKWVLFRKQTKHTEIRWQKFL